MIENLINNLTLYMQESVLLAFLAAYIGGVLISFTPCTYPLIPVTVGFIGAQGSTSKLHGFILSVFYVGGLALTYSLLGALAALSGKLFGQIQTTTWTYFIMANLCLFMGLAMLDVFTISLPIPQKLTKFSGNKKNFFSSFLIGAISGVVIGPCTAPVLAVLLGYVAMQQSYTGHESAFCFCLRHGNAADYRRNICRPDCRPAPFGNLDDKNKSCLRLDINWRSRIFPIYCGSFVLLKLRGFDE